MAVYPTSEQLEMRGCTAYLREAYRTKLGIYTKVELVFDDPEKVKEYEVQLHLNHRGDSLQANRIAPIQKNVWIGEDRKVHQLIEANMVGYQNSLLDEGSRMTVSLKRLVEYPWDTYGEDKYTSLSTCPILPTKFLLVVEIARSPAANIPACPPKQGPHVGVETAPPASIIVSK